MRAPKTLLLAAATVMLTAARAKTISCRRSQRHIMKGVVGGLLVAFATAAAAPAYAKTTVIATVTGHCTNIVGMGVQTNPAWCSDKLQNFDMANERNGFTFMVNKPGEPKPLIISFFGWGPKQTHPDKDHVNQPIDRVDFTFDGSTDHLNATGSCAFSNAYKGVATVACRAKTSEGIFAGEFVSNGVSPDIYAMPAQP
jgi:hypothetical protein